MNYFDTVKLSNRDMMLVISGFISRTRKQSATREEINAFVAKFNEEYYTSKMTLDAIELMRSGELIVCEKDGEIAWTTPTERDKEVYNKICNNEQA
jgi:hypothetical protein